MVCYCCVQGCGNNSNVKKKDPNSVISFHAFPSNQELKTKWLKAIGRPNWTPANHARICSAHFKYEQINYDGCRIRIKDDAVPVNLLPPNSNFEASNVEACRICLATDIELCSLQDPQLGACMETIAGVNQNAMCLEGLPQYVCYTCAPILMKCHKLIEKCMFSQTILLDIFVKNGQITKSLIEKQNKITNSDSVLATTEELSNYLVKCDDVNSAPFPTNSCDMYFKSENNTHIDSKSYTVLGTDCKVEIYGVDFCANYDLEEDRTSSVVSSPKVDVVEEEKLKSKKCTKNEVTAKRIKGLTLDETNMLKYFDIVQLSLPEQIEEWQKSVIRRTLNSQTEYQCKICYKTFASTHSYQHHIKYHDPSLGQDECPVCKLRFKSATLVAAHRKRAHSKKFFCKMCPKSFNNVNVAKKHSRWHSGYQYRCPCCAFTSMHESALSAHRRRAHGPVHVCVHCGRHYSTARGLNAHKNAAHKQDNDKEISKEHPCKQCDINFASEGARRVHLLTSSQHKKKPSLCDPTMDPILRNCCNKCGVECTSFKDLLVHMRAEHPHPRRTDQSWKGDNPYPLDCELCGEKICSRKKHWFHVRRRHPKHVDSYHPIITVICDTCGKGFQNSTKLRIHQLRHSTPKVRCAQCPRLFYDKYALNRHAQTHSEEKPHQCRICGRAFKLLSNLERHARVHTDVAPYECTICNKKFKYSSSVSLHVRTVHYKLPHPTRKKRNRSVKDNGDS
ncbi:zinc finger protein 471 isoform X3 [Spodoptera frugiperda]|uniref:Zinc finger protein 471 isoform X3 n=1 Tax=Spodoptera frugiperda TaxID=7108 RepID=A0A9R0D8E4_SPOFR|nr:zinc finger protein 471 isoform X3 [Spodoptera frugiperda]